MELSPYCQPLRLRFVITNIRWDNRNAYLMEKKAFKAFLRYIWGLSCIYLKCIIKIVLTYVYCETTVNRITTINIMKVSIMPPNPFIIHPSLSPTVPKQPLTWFLSLLVRLSRISHKWNHRIYTALYTQFLYSFTCDRFGYLQPLLLQSCHEQLIHVHKSLNECMLSVPLGKYVGAEWLGSMVGHA